MMMDKNWVVVLSGIVTLLIVILVGLFARKKNILTDESAGRMSHFIVDYCMPAMVFTSMLATVTKETIKSEWFLPLLGAVLILFGFLLGYLFSFVFRIKSRPTYVFLTGVANWIYLPLPIATALYGAAGIRAVLLFNVGAQIILWSVGVAIIKNEKPTIKTLTELLKNNGLIATVLGIAIAIINPYHINLETVALLKLTPIGMVAKTIFMSLLALGSLTIPLTLVISGVQIGAVNVAMKRYFKDLAAIIFTKLLIIPIIAALLFFVLTNILGVHIDHVITMVALLILAMPTAVSCSLFAERFGGDSTMAALSIFYTTLLSCITLPFIFYLISHVPFK